VDRRAIAVTYQAILADELEPEAFSILVVDLKDNPVGRRLVELIEPDSQVLAESDRSPKAMTYFNRAPNRGLAAYFRMPGICHAVRRGFVRVVSCTAEGTAAVEIPKRLALT
jgi:hypothetical protein